ncbi:DUF1573 domain-containing protein [bacterium]|nr:DUF1573 domain-containing protein [bacterium]
MKKKIVIISFVVALCALGFVFQSKLHSGISLFQDLKKAKIEFTEEEFNFGKIKEGELVEHVFTFTNIGNDTLKIAQVRASCGCTATLLSANRIPPRGMGEIKTTFNSKGRFGIQKKTLTVFSNDSDSPAIKLVFRAEIEASENKNP